MLYFNDSFYTLHSMALFSPSFLEYLLLYNLNDIHGKPKQLVVILTARLPKCVSVAQGPVRLSWRAFFNHSSGRILCLWQYS